MSAPLLWACDPLARIVAHWRGYSCHVWVTLGHDGLPINRSGWRWHIVRDGVTHGYGEESSGDAARVACVGALEMCPR